MEKYSDNIMGKEQAPLIYGKLDNIKISWYYKAKMEDFTIIIFMYTFSIYDPIRFTFPHSSASLSFNIWITVIN